MAQYAWLVALLPFVAWFLIATVGQRLRRNGDWLSILAVAIAFVIAIGVLADVARGGGAARSFLWAEHGALRLKVGFQVDPLTALMLFVVTLVSLMVQVFSLGYMHGDVRYKRYYAMLSFFTFAMVGLVLADNFALLFVFWEMVGVASYLLIGHWFEKKEIGRAAIKAFLTTQTGDIGMLIGIMLIFSRIGSFNFAEIVDILGSGQIPIATVTVMAVLVFAGAVGKSAQFPLHVWLPDAMAGPTPVSALIHAATMVAAGVYLVARTFGIFAVTPDAMTVVAYIGGFTALFAATIALVREDIKQVLAYSTISQLGYMMMALGVGGYTAGVFHLTTHAFFKALLFLGSGSVIHAVHTQNMHEMGGLSRKMPITAWTWVIGAASLAGIPPFSGFFSKDEILLDAFRSGHTGLFWVGVTSAVITAFYITRATWLTFFGAPRDKHKYDHSHESPLSMAAPLVVLGVFAALAGFAGSKFTDFAFGRFIHFGEFHEAEPSGFVSVVAIGAGVLGVLGGLAVYAARIVSREKLARALWPIYALLKNKYYVDELYQLTFVKGTLALSRLAGWVDLNIIDRIVNWIGKATVGTGSVSGSFDLEVIDGAVNGVGEAFVAGGRKFRRLQTGYVQSYVLALFAFAVVLVIIFAIGG